VQLHFVFYQHHFPHPHPHPHPHPPLLLDPSYQQLFKDRFLKSVRQPRQSSPKMIGFECNTANIIQLYQSLIAEGFAIHVPV
jgi:hypothetical protein